MQFTSGTDKIISLEILSKDIIEPVLELDCTRMNKQVFNIKWCKSIV